MKHRDGSVLHPKHTNLSMFGVHIILAFHYVKHQSRPGVSSKGKIIEENTKLAQSHKLERLGLFLLISRDRPVPVDLSLISLKGKAP